MSPPPGLSSVFLEREGYRQRRLRDALRLLPVLGLLLWLVPIAWPGESGAGLVLYLFGVWLLLIILSVLLTARLGPDSEAEGRGSAGR